MLYLEHICSVRYTQYVLYYGLPGTDCSKDEKNGQRSRPHVAANTVISCKSKTKISMLNISNATYVLGSDCVLKSQFSIAFAEILDLGTVGLLASLLPYWLVGVAGGFLDGLN